MARILRERSSAIDVYWDDELLIAWCSLKVHRHEEAEARESIAALERLRNSLAKKKIRVVIDLRQIESISRDARVYYSGEHAASIQRATALMTGSVISRVIANFMMGLNKPISPTQMFTEEYMAVAWLHEFSDT